MSGNLEPAAAVVAVPDPRTAAAWLKHQLWVNPDLPPPGGEVWCYLDDNRYNSENPFAPLERILGDLHTIHRGKGLVFRPLGIHPGAAATTSVLIVAPEGAQPNSRVIPVLNWPTMVAQYDDEVLDQVSKDPHAMIHELAMRRWISIRFQAAMVEAKCPLTSYDRLTDLASAGGEASRAAVVSLAAATEELGLSAASVERRRLAASLIGETRSSSEVRRWVTGVLANEAEDHG